MAKYFTKDGDEYKEVDENLLTQADVDKVVESRLERERKKFASSSSSSDSSSSSVNGDGNVEKISFTIISLNFLNSSGSNLF